MATRLHCPYCYLPLRPQQIMFRCAGRIGASGRRCEEVIDPLLAAHTGDTKPRFPAFRADGGKRSAVHPDCHGRTFLRICGHCHSQLPTHFGEADTRLIALVGAKESGKTVFMTVLLHELQHQVGNQFGLAVLGADEHTMEHFRSEFETTLYDDHRLHQATATAVGDRGRRPFVFSISRVRHRRVLPEVVDRSLFSFFDTAGEDLRSVESVERHVRYLGAADGIVLLLDPLQMRGARPLADPGTLLPDQGSPQDDPANVLSRITNLLHDALATPKGKRIKRPIAVAFTKMDALDGTLPEESSLLENSPHGAAEFDNADSLAVHDEVGALLDKWQGSGMQTVLEQNFEHYRFFGLSALGASPIKDEHDAQRVSEYGVHPRRVQDPFLWLLSTFGTIPAKKA
ncbi:TRAFAC clade GTPase domain-containing protein [Paractinoplanes globisporus]|uniref:Double-GTPase 2 domain-containing protein n=1 Tax=Paractinoplanes globisporus TaxID=113565 RepID=A0ABW6W8V8_9ACTN|nr:hypothetical protein [Actinoplanes globisporus]